MAIIALYMDHNVPLAITYGLRQRGVDVLTAYEDGHHTVSDPELLDRAGALGRLLFSQDDDLLKEASARQRAGLPFGGVIYAHQRAVTVGQCVDDLELIATAGLLEEFVDRVTYLPYR